MAKTNTSDRIRAAGNPFSGMTLAAMKKKWSSMTPAQRKANEANFVIAAKSAPKAKPKAPPKAPPKSPPKAPPKKDKPRKTDESKMLAEQRKRRTDESNMLDKQRARRALDRRKNKANSGSGRDGRFGSGTYGSGRPSDPKGKTDEATYLKIQQRNKKR